ncbi:MAG: hypothetical protein B7Z20_12550 [Sphingobium sp. 32-64-5]|nr:MAG: hypothetical protein B7Z20_12550 [Sphingobium sp. 32-64-5]
MLANGAEFHHLASVAHRESARSGANWQNLGSRRDYYAWTDLADSQVFAGRTDVNSRKLAMCALALAIKFSAMASPDEVPPPTAASGRWTQ